MLVQTDETQAKDPSIWHYAWPRGATWWGYPLPYRDDHGVYVQSGKITPHVAAQIVAWQVCAETEAMGLASDAACRRYAEVRCIHEYMREKGNSNADIWQSSISMEDARSGSIYARKPGQLMREKQSIQLPQRIVDLIDGEEAQRMHLRRHVLGIIGDCTGSVFARRAVRSDTAVAYLLAEGHFCRARWPAECGLQRPWKTGSER